MKIAITGHTQGIGNALYTLLSNSNEVIGFSRSNGYDITTSSDEIINQTLDCDVFINNAYGKFSQTTVFDKWFDKHSSDINKTIVNINSRIKYAGSHMLVDKEYIFCKKELDKHARSAMFAKERKCRIINISPGWVNTSMKSNALVPLGITPDAVPALDAEFLAEYIQMAINLPQHIEIGELSIWANPDWANPDWANPDK